TLRPNEIFVAVNQRTFTDRYVLLVHQTSGIRQLSDLKGRKCIIPSSARMSLALPWLDTLLASQGGAEGFLAEVRYVSKPSMAVLPVFFRQVDACLITQKAFEVSEELNPQLRKDLHVVALSPEVVPSVFFFTRGRASIAREQLEPAIVGLHETPEGQQVLTVFQCERMVQCRIERLEDTRRLVEEHQRLNRSKIVRLSGVSIAPDTAHENP
ncbi:MAG TPA: PhnD/SsuA/transferrin family substrate-binding protein, partial [Verrucomicrobiae bacterium]|nr:PhnD/SsuA/transferrin family substrate-binding protein [Verrucomicrobiae bacterium]